MRKIVFLFYIFIVLLLMSSCTNTKDIYSKRITNLDSYIKENYDGYVLEQQKSLEYKALFSQMDLSVFCHPIPAKDGSVKLASEGNCALVAIYNSISAYVNPPIIYLKKVEPKEEFLSGDFILKREDDILLPDIYLNIRKNAIEKYHRIESFHYNELKNIYIDVASEFGDVSYGIYKELNSNSLNKIVEYINEGYSPIINLYKHPAYNKENHSVSVSGYRVFRNKDNEELVILEIQDGNLNKENEYNSTYLDFSNIVKNKGKGSVQLFKIKT